MSNHKFNKYNNGKIFIYREKIKRNDFAAKKNVSDIDNLEFVVKLDFEESSVREQDREFAMQNDFSLSTKVRTRRFNNVDNKCKAVINNYLYDIAYADKLGTDMWLYLEGVKALDS